jgi:hypothetical protein
MSDEYYEEPKHKQRFVWVKDKAGNEYVCRIGKSEKHFG